MDGVFQYEWHIPSSPARVPAVVREMLECLEGLSREEHSDFRLMINELIFNAILHGNKSDEAKFVHVELIVDGGAVRISITDEGEGFNAYKTLAGIGLDENLVRETGRGISIVSGLADHVAYSDEGRRVTISKKIWKP